MTTLFNVICGFVKARTGSITWCGRHLRPRPERLVRAGIVRAVQGVGLFPGLTVAGLLKSAAGPLLEGVLSTAYLPSVDDTANPWISLFCKLNDQ